jgi:hypothetical protein
MHERWKILDQDDLSLLFQKLEKEDNDNTSYEKLSKAIKEQGGVEVVVFDNTDGDIGGACFEDLFKLLREMKFTILDDPRFDGDYTGDQGWVIFPPA